MTESQFGDQDRYHDEGLGQSIRDLSRSQEILTQRMLSESAERRRQIRAETQAVLRAIDRFESQGG